MYTYTHATVDYKGKEISGLILPYSVQRITSKEWPEGYTCIGKQQFGRGLRICFIPTDMIIPAGPGRELKEGEEWISGYRTNFDLEVKKEELGPWVKEMYVKDSSDNHLAWVIKTAINNKGLNNVPDVAESIVRQNWN